MSRWSYKWLGCGGFFGFFFGFFLLGFASLLEEGRLLRMRMRSSTKISQLESESEEDLATVASRHFAIPTYLPACLPALHSSTSLSAGGV